MFVFFLFSPFSLVFWNFWNFCTGFHRVWSFCSLTVFLPFSLSVLFSLFSFSLSLWNSFSHSRLFSAWSASALFSAIHSGFTAPLIFCLLPTASALSVFYTCSPLRFSCFSAYRSFSFLSGSTFVSPVSCSLFGSAHLGTSYSHCVTWVSVSSGFT